ncbi:MAG: hypothetical protein WBW84_16680 [Acidobacteriaceae bacterium]
MTLDELSCGPGAETVRPISRQQQLTYDSWFPAAFPRREFCEKDGQDDPHLRSSTDLISCRVWNSSRYMGLLEDFFLEDHSWHISSLLIKMGDWVYHEKCVPSSKAVAISWGNGRVRVDTMQIPADSVGEKEPSLSPSKVFVL